MLKYLHKKACMIQFFNAFIKNSMTPLATIFKSCVLGK